MDKLKKIPTDNSCIKQELIASHRTPISHYALLCAREFTCICSCVSASFICHLAANSSLLLLQLTIKLPTTVVGDNGCGSQVVTGRYFLSWCLLLYLRINFSSHLKHGLPQSSAGWRLAGACIWANGAHIGCMQNLYNSPD